jgi:hypothetical protein
LILPGMSSRSAAGAGSKFAIEPLKHIDAVLARLPDVKIDYRRVDRWHSKRCWNDRRSTNAKTNEDGEKIELGSV